MPAANVRSLRSASTLHRKFMFSISVPLAIAIDAATGEPETLWRRYGHPVTWFGALIDRLEQRLNRGYARREKGIVALVALIAATVFPALIVAAILDGLPGIFAVPLEAALASTLIAHRSLVQHVGAVANAASLDGARQALRRIVGREVTVLDEAGVARAGLESLSENLSDGVVAPILFFAIGGLPGLVLYKVVNTADSMIGHRSPRYEAFGWASARFDDLLNYIPARLTAAVTLFTAQRNIEGWDAVAVDARKHVSPNAGWPESAFARVLGISLGGPRRYGSRMVDGAWINESGAAPAMADLSRGIRLSIRVGVLEAAAYVVLALVSAIF